jgi:hypothetical protein
MNKSNTNGVYRLEIDGETLNQTISNIYQLDTDISNLQKDIKNLKEKIGDFNATETNAELKRLGGIDKEQNGQIDLLENALSINEGLGG